LETIGESTLKLICRTIPLLIILLFGAALGAHAQSATVDFGLGTATDKSSGQSIDTFSDGNFYNTPKLGGTFGTFGASFMIKPHLGIGGEYSWRFSQGTYAGLNYRPAFYDFNAIWEPISESSKVVPVIEGGLGGANLRFYAPPTCDQFGGCTSSAENYLESSNHFALHAAVGVRFYVRGGLFVRPQVDLHWVDNFFQFGSGWVPEYTVAIGYTLGKH
jgi:hypothetical protein